MKQWATAHGYRKRCKLQAVKPEDPSMQEHEPVPKRSSYKLLKNIIERFLDPSPRKSAIEKASSMALGP